MEPNDAQLVQNYLEGNENAIKTLISRHLSRVYNFTYRLSGNMDEANDITQETFIKVWKNLKKYDQGKKFSTWILYIARNSTIDWLRRKRPAVFSEYDDFYEDTLADEELLAHELFEKEENKNLIEKALEKIPFDFKSVILLHNHEELTFEEIASITGKPMNTVKSQYRRALIWLKKYFNNAPK